MLSETCGAAEILAAWSQLVSPFDVVEQSEAIATLLCMDVAERRRAARTRRAIAQEHTSEVWIRKQIEALETSI